MIDKIKVTNHLGEAITFELDSPEKSGFSILSVEGLGPTKAEINTTAGYAIDGAVYNSAHISERNIVFSLAFTGPTETPEELRLKTYKYFPIKKRIKVTVYTENRTCYAFGYVESNEPNIFTSFETSTISIICPDPFFYSIDDIIELMTAHTPTFEFPFSNESLTLKLLEFGTIQMDTIKNIFYEGDYDTGLIITFHFLDSLVGDLLIYNTETNETMTIDLQKVADIIGGGIQVSDDIIISTIKGNKYVRFLRGGAYTNIINALDLNTDWLILRKGDNVFSYYCANGVEYLQVYLDYSIIYEGV